jgi:hypothetical protein
VTEAEKQQADRFLDRIEIAVGSWPDRHGPNAALITEILHAVNGLRTLLGVKGTH